MADFPILFFMVAPQGSVKVSVMVMLLMESRFVTRDKGIEIVGGMVCKPRGNLI
jgi:hypothetical protein